MASNYIDLPVGNGVVSLDGLSGALTLVAGSGISISNGTNTITIVSTVSPGVSSIGTFDSQTPSAEGLVASGSVLYAQSASDTVPGMVNISAQTLAGVKTFSDNINADGGIDLSVTGTLTIGATNSSVINIGNSGATVNIQGSTIIENTTELDVTDPLITLNSGGGAGSGQNSGIQIEEASSITGYAETSANRNSWIFKAPNTAGIATITPGGSGITINQSSHNPVTIGSPANGLSLDGSQVISLALSSTSTTGALSNTDWNTFNGKQAAGSYITALTGDGTASGPGSAVLTLATVNSNVGSFGSSTAIPSFTVNAKGLITAASTNVVIAPAGTLTGTTLASNVVTSSLTSVGTISSGTWNGSVIDIAHGGTNNGSLAVTAGGTLYTDGSKIMNVGAGTTGQKLISQGSSSPIWKETYESCYGALINDSCPGSSTRYMCIVGGPIGLAATEDIRSTIIPKAGTFSRLYLTTSGTQPATGSMVVTARVNGSDQTMTVTIAANATSQTYTDLVHTFNVNAGDLVAFSVVNNASTTSIKILQIGMYFTNS